MKKTVLSLALVAFAFSGFANTPKSAAKAESTSTTQSGPAVYEYIGPVGGDVNNPSNYSTTPMDNHDDLCPGGSQRCAATFQRDASNQRTGLPQQPTYNKEAE